MMTQTSSIYPSTCIETVPSIQVVKGVIGTVVERGAGWESKFLFRS